MCARVIFSFSSVSAIKSVNLFLFTLGALPPTISNVESNENRSDGDIQLVGGTSPLEGRAEIYHE